MLYEYKLAAKVTQRVVPRIIKYYFTDVPYNQGYPRDSTSSKTQCVTTLCHLVGLNPLNAKLIPSAICWHYYELTLNSTLAG